MGREPANQTQTKWDKFRPESGTWNLAILEAELHNRRIAWTANQHAGKFTTALEDRKDILREGMRIQRVVMVTINNEVLEHVKRKIENVIMSVVIGCGTRSAGLQENPKGT